MYIDTILAHHGLAPAVLEVHSNPAEWRGGALRVGPYHTAPHGCRHCPSNLCKGQVGGDDAVDDAAGGLVRLLAGWGQCKAALDIVSAPPATPERTAAVAAGRYRQHAVSPLRNQLPCSHRC